MKNCSKCKIEKPVSDFGKNKSRPDGLAHWCKACHGASNKEYYKTNTEIARAATKKWNLENSARKAEKQKQWYAANPGADARFKRERRLRGEFNKIADAAKTGRRRAQRNKATPAWSDKTKVLEFYYAADTLGMLTGEHHEVDHIVPLNGVTVSGLHNEFNLQVLTSKANKMKSNLYWPGMP